MVTTNSKMGRDPEFNVLNMADEMLNEKDDNNQCTDGHTLDTGKFYPKKKDRPFKKNKGYGVRDALVDISNKTTSSNTSGADANPLTRPAHDKLQDQRKSLLRRPGPCSDINVDNQPFTFNFGALKTMFIMAQI